MVSYSVVSRTFLPAETRAAGISSRDLSPLMIKNDLAEWFWRRIGMRAVADLAVSDWFEVSSFRFEEITARAEVSRAEEPTVKRGIVDQWRGAAISWLLHGSQSWGSPRSGVLLARVELGASRPSEAPEMAVAALTHPSAPLRLMITTPSYPWHPRSRIRLSSSVRNVSVRTGTEVAS